MSPDALARPVVAVPVAESAATSVLVIDVGNTRLKWAQYAHAAPFAPVLAHGAVFWKPSTSWPSRPGRR